MMFSIRWTGFCGALGLLLTSPVLAGGGGENMLLVVNANDENAIRIATAYQQIRNIPTSNILFINPVIYTGTIQSHAITQTNSTNVYLNTVANAISSRGLSNQIDYIGLIGTPISVSYNYTYQQWNSSTGTYDTKTGSYSHSLAYQMSQIDQLRSGIHPNTMTYYNSSTGGTSSWFQTPLYQTDLTIGENDAIHHSDVYTKSYGGTNVDAQYYMSGAIGYTGQFGNTADQVIANLQYTASGDGTQPRGTIYFEENNDVRSNTRESQWPGVQTALTDRGIAYVQESYTSGNTPKNRSDVMGAIIGAASYTTPNGSTYLPGSWADSLTSHGTTFSTYNQTKATSLIAAGAGGSSGTVTEPYAFASRFPHASTHVFLADGSTMGEAFYKGTASPDIQLAIGDMLAQPGADLPTIALNSAPAHGQSVSGTVGISAAASLTSPIIATGIQEMRLLVDGKVVQTHSGANADFNLDTLGLSDGQHELRIVAVNNAAAESQNAKVWSVNVSNKGQSVAATSGNMIAQDKQVLSVNVAANAGTGSAVNRIELRSLGRVMGQVNSVNGSINLDASKLAYGDNPIIPVAILADGSEVAGSSINVKRNPTYIQGIQNYAGPRTAGVKVEYFEGKGATTIAASNFTGAPTQTVQMNHSAIKSSIATGQDNYLESRNKLELHPAALNIDKLATRMTGAFEVQLGKEGEYAFQLNQTNDSAQLSVDGQLLLAYDNRSWGPSSFSQVMARMHLGQGVHIFELLSANIVNTSDASTLNRYDIALFYQGPDGIWDVFDTTTAFTIPEPASMAFLAMGSMILLPRRRSGI